MLREQVYRLYWIECDDCRQLSPDDVTAESAYKWATRAGFIRVGSIRTYCPNCAAKYAEPVDT